MQKYKEEASWLLEKEKVNLEEVHNCLEKGELFDIFLPEVDKLRARAEQLEWLKEVKDVLEDPSEISTDMLTGLEQRGCSLKPRPEVEQGLSRLCGLRVTMDQWEVRANNCLQASPKPCLEEVERMVREGENISSGLPALEKLRDAVRKAKVKQIMKTLFFTNVNLNTLPTPLPHPLSLKITLSSYKIGT